MKTIEKRAEEYAHKTISDNADGKLNAILIEEPYKKEGYIKGATEQKKIDIDKACKVYENELRDILRITNAPRKGVGEGISITGRVKDFRKAMEE